MKLLYDARMVNPLQVHGIARYTYELVLWGLAHRPQHRIAVLSRQPEHWRAVQAEHPQLEVFQASSRPFHPREQLELPKVIAASGADLVHFPSLSAPALCPVPYVINAHDLIPWHFPSSPLHRPYLATFTRWCCARALRVLSGSTHAAFDAQRLLGVAPSRITVIPHGGLEGTPPQPTLGDASDKRPYLLVVTNPKPHKNLQVVLQAYPRLAERWDLNVVCAATPALDALQTQYPGVRRFSGISDQELAQLYAGANAVIVPSLYEGFGLPALEGMQRGTPVVSSHATSLPEVVGEAGLYFDPHSVDSLVQQLERLNDPSLREKLREMGFERARQFSWAATALRHWQLYETLT